MMEPNAVLEFLKSKGPIQISDIQRHFGCPEKPARNSIDQLRAKGEPVWYDDRRGFWWANDRKPSGTPHTQWKRKAP